MRRFGAHRQTGFSLVELMVAMVLGLIITGAAISLFSTNQRTFSLQQNMARIQEQGDLAMRFINQDVRLAGNMSDDVAATFMPGIILDASSAVTGGSAIPPGDDGGSDSDRLTLAYHGEKDCQGNGGTGMKEIVNTYWVGGDDGDELYCRGNQSGSSNGVVLLRGIKSFQVLYGVDQSTDGIPFASQYLRADEVLASADVDQSRIVAVKIGLLMEADLPVLGGEDQDQTFYILDRQVDVSAGRTLRRQFFSTVAIRNYPWDVI
ncbi:type IV pilus assembly protein PilW [Alloalcanivorax xenomutans]|uniref:PilW family protein n=1 Tax=Alloalcanivorax xenomutans TaxID=1094342 RepID=UPI000BC80348|nr:PilW family protein [Alloalcanivorax xenomutans]SOC21758.1 type IV pilus assembly protein PilW [Alloalcanivorax xenomutans]